MPFGQPIHTITFGHVDTFLQLTQLSLDSAERLATYHFELSKQLLEEQANQIERLAQAKNPQALLHESEKQITHLLEQSLTHYRQLYNIAADIYKGLTHLGEQHSGRINQSIQHSFETTVQQLPVKSEQALDSVKTSMEVANAAMQSLGKLAQQVSVLTENHVKTANRVATRTLKAAEASRNALNPSREKH